MILHLGQPWQSQAGGFHVPDLNSGVSQYRRDCIRSDGFRMLGKLEALPMASRPELAHPDFEVRRVPSLGTP